MADPQSLLPTYLQTFGVGSNYSYPGVTPELAMREQALNRRQQIANLMMQRGMQPTGGKMVGRFYVADSPVQGLANLGYAAAGALGSQAIDAQRQELAEKDRNMLADAVRQYQQATAPQTMEGARPTVASMPPAQPGYGLAPRPAQQPVTTELAGPGAPVQVAASPDARRQALVELMASQHPQAQMLGKLLSQQDFAQQERDTNRAFLQHEAELNRQNRIDTQQAGFGKDILIASALGMNRKDIEAMREANALEVARIGAKGKTDSAEIRAGAGATKPMPARALQMQQEELDAIGSASGVNADLRAIEWQIESGKLKLGMVENLASRGKNALGMGDENSRNFQSFKSTLETQRNNSLRLNKGVQTEGDAVRAWNELFENMNDPGVVKQRLQEIQRINERAVNFRKMNIDVIRQNYGQDPLPTQGYEAPPAAVGQGSSAVAPFNDPDKERRYQEWKSKHK